MAFGAVEHSWMQEVRPSTIMAQDPQTFVRQHVAPLLYERTEGQAFGQPDCHIHDEKHFWTEAANQMFSVLHLNGFTITDWFPRTPGLFWSQGAEEVRQNTFPGGHGASPELGEYYLPLAKMALIEQGGIGTIRLGPKRIDNARCWFGTALKGKNCDAGIPLAIPEALFIRSHVRWGQDVDMIGRIRFLEEAGLDQVAAGAHGARPVIVMVEELMPSGLFANKEPISIRPVILFERPQTQNYMESGPGYVFVQCKAGADEDFCDSGRARPDCPACARQLTINHEGH